MNSRRVNAELRSVVRPFLRDVGFGIFTSRNAWRHRSNRIEIVRVQSFNTCDADRCGCTTYSFTVSIGSFIPEVTYEPGGQFRWHTATPERPQVFDCSLRRYLEKGLSQPQLEESGIWYVDPSGDNLAEVVRDVRRVLTTEALPWFDVFADDQRTLEIIASGAEEEFETMAVGGFPSPRRSGLIGSLRGRVAHASR